MSRLHTGRNSSRLLRSPSSQYVVRRRFCGLAGKGLSYDWANHLRMYWDSSRGKKWKHPVRATGRINPIPPAVDRSITKENLLNIVTGYSFGEENGLRAVSVLREVDWSRWVVKYTDYDWKNGDVFGMCSATHVF